MSILKDGFLSADLDTWIARNRADHAGWFALVRDLNQHCVAHLGRTTVNTSEGVADSRVLAMLLFLRALTNFEGAVLMAERGLIIEAKTLARSCLESVFALGAMIAGGSDFAERMRQADIFKRRAGANWIMTVPDLKETMGAEFVEGLTSYLQRVAGEEEALKDLSIEEVARLAGTTHLYVFYRDLSGDAAHPTISALDRYVEFDAAGQASLKWGPDRGGREAPSVLGPLTSFMLAGCLHLNEITQDQELGDRTAELFERFKVLEEPDTAPKPHTAPKAQ